MSGPLARLLGPLALLAPLALAAQPAAPVPTPAAAPVPGDQLTLTEAVLLAEQRDARVPVSLAITRADIARARLERAPLLPQLSASASVGYNTQEVDSEFFPAVDESYRDTTAALELRQAVFRWDMLSRWDRSDLRAELARIEEHGRVQDFLTRIVDRYSAVLEARAAQEFAEAEARSLAEEQRTIRDRESVGLATRTGVRETEARAALAEAELIGAQDRVLEAEQALAELIGPGYAPPQPLPPNPPPLGTATDSVEAFVALAQTQALEVQALALRRAIAESEVASAKAEALPQLDLIGRYSDDDSSDSPLGQQREASRIALQLSLPIYSGGAARHGLQAALAEEDSLRAQLDLARRQAAQEARNAWRAVDTAYRRLAALSAAADAATLALQATRDGVEIGRRTQLDLLAAQSAELRARRDLVLARYALLRALTRREAAIGDLRGEDVARLQTLFNRRVSGADTRQD